MATLEDFVRRLDMVDATGWETEYARCHVDILPEEAQALVLSDRPYANWLMFRFDAGLPGTALPSFEHAFNAVLRGRGGTPLDAYRLIFASDPCPPNLPSELLLALLCNAGVCAFTRGPTWLAHWLLGRAGIAAIALGHPERAWQYLDLLTLDGQRHPLLDNLALFEPLRHSPLQSNAWIQATICHVWPQLNVATFPSLPYPAQPASSYEEVLDELSRIGAYEVYDLVQGFIVEAGLSNVQNHEGNELIRELRHRVMRGERVPPEVEHVPSWFARWAHSVMRSGEFELARLAGLILGAHGGEPTLVSMLIARVSSACDLEMVAAFPWFSQQPVLLAELIGARNVLPVDVADMLVAAAQPYHVYNAESMEQLIPHLDLLDGLRTADDSLIRTIARTLRHGGHARRAELEAAPELFAQLMREVERAARQLGGEGRSLGVEEVERVAASITVPLVTTSVCNAVFEETTLLPINQLLLALALRRALHDTELGEYWSVPFARYASDAIHSLGAQSLLVLSLGLVNEVIEARHPHIQCGNLFFRRSNLLRALHPGDRQQQLLAVTDLETARRLARAERNPGLLAAATSAWVKLQVFMALNDGTAHEDLVTAADVLLREATDFAADRMSLGLLQQARAHLVRMQDVEASAAVFDDALSNLDPGTQLWMEVASELVTSLVRAGRVDDALLRAEECLRHVASDDQSVELAMLHIAFGECLIACQRWEQAKRHLEDALRLTRGIDGSVENMARVHLAGLGLRSDNLDTADEHLRVLCARRSELSPLVQRDVARLEISAAAIRGDVSQQRNLLALLLALETNARILLELRLEMTLLDVNAGQAVDGIEALVLCAMETGLPPLHEGILADLLCNHHGLLSRAVIERAIIWARPRRPSIYARLLSVVGDVDEAHNVLRTALRSTLNHHEQVCCTHQLMTTLDAAHRVEQRTLCEALERLLEVEDVPYMRINLAEAMRLSGGDDITLMRRAREHVRRALCATQEPHAQEQGHRTLGFITINLLRCAFPQSSPSLADEASWLLSEHPLSARDTSTFLLSAVEVFLRTGPLTHPDVVAIARRMFDAATSPPDQNLHALLGARLDWVESCVRDGVYTEAPPSRLGGPFDTCSGWLVDLVQGRSIAQQPSDLEPLLQLLVTIVRMRPDVADRILARLIELQHHLDENPRVDLLSQVYAAVASPAESDARGWPILQAAIAAVPAHHQHHLLTNISSAALRMSVGVSGGMTVDRGDMQIGMLTGMPRAVSCFEHGVSLMNYAYQDLDAPQAEEQLNHVRSLLAEAVAIARENSAPELMGFLVSYGNALKMGCDADVEAALRIYEEADAFDASVESKAVLWKVRADALLLRGGADDLRQADELLNRSCQHRQGEWLAETLFSRAQVTRRHPDIDEIGRVQRAASFIMDAVRAHPGFGDKPAVVDFMCHCLDEWSQVCPQAPTLSRLREEFIGLHPDQADRLAHPTTRASEHEMNVIFAALQHPASFAFSEIRFRLVPRNQLNLDLFGILEHFSPSVRTTIQENHEHNSLIGHPEQIEELLRELSPNPESLEYPGVLAARVFLLDELARLNRRSAEDVRDATQQARDAVASIGDVLIRSTLLRELATVWSPSDDTGAHLSDFNLAVDLLRDCVQLEGGEDTALGDTLTLLARALRYASCGDLQENLLESRRLYELRLARARGIESPYIVANILHNLADVLTQLGIGGRLESLRDAERFMHEAVTMASPSNIASYKANLAWIQTQIGIRQDGEQSIAHLRAALATFESVDRTLLAPHELRNMNANSMVCEATLATLVADNNAAVSLWRRYLMTLDENTPARMKATAQHNLADALLSTDRLTLAALNEGVALLCEAVEVRTIELDPRHHWETTFGIGHALRRAQDAGLLQLMDMVSPDDAYRWLNRALNAARILGPGEELLSTGFELTALSTHLQSCNGIIERSESAWAAVNRSFAYLLLSQQNREREVRYATGTALRLANKLAERARSGAVRGCEFVLQGADARHVERWVVRSQLPVRRPLQARLARPQSVSAADWAVWRDALEVGDQRQMINALRLLRSAAPNFLGEDCANDVAWRWLEERPGSVAVSLVTSERISLVLLMQIDANGDRNSHVLGLRLPPQPCELDELAKLMRVADVRARDVLDSLAQWLRVGVVAPIESFLGRSPTAVLWSPGPSLRVVAPGAIWCAVPAAATTSLVLPDLTASPRRRRSSLVALADPGALAADQRLDLRGFGLETLNRLEQAAALRGPVQLLGSVGSSYGRALFGARDNVRDTPASARDILSEAAEHEVLVLIAHGEVESLEEAALVCVDASGSINRLDVRLLASAPDAFAGATILLLSCEGGRMGDALLEPGGLAGTLLSAGARCVVAPLWPVRLDVAEQVARAVLEGMAAGEQPWVVLARLQLQANGESPTLGRPPLSLAARNTLQELQRLAFVAWVG